MERINMNSKLLKKCRNHDLAPVKHLLHPVNKATRKQENFVQHGSGFNEKTVKPKTINKLTKISRSQIDQRQLFYKHNIYFLFFLVLFSKVL